ncbi:MAG: hypothetical protein UZ14_CFX002003155 [Chloroflexi bacterium OLB14]|nr:MAG: hypothetical protein UZ14_CFX002003155 [Chloroflexi bacterium OLB14]
MDPITSAIIAALAAGVTAGLTDTAKKLISDLYNTIKEKIGKKHGKDSKAIKAINDLESEPDFAPYQSGLQQRVNELKLDKDSELISLATKLLSIIQESQSKANLQTIQNVYGNGNAVAGTGGTATINVQQTKPRRRKTR